VAPTALAAGIAAALLSSRRGRTFYLSPAGSDLDAGLSPASPWLHPSRLMQEELLPGDEVCLVGTAANAPLRGHLATQVEGVHYKAQAAYQYLCGNYDLAHDGWFEDAGHQYWMNAWDSPTQATGWTSGGTVSQEDAIVCIGSYSARITGAWSYLRRNFGLAAGNRATFSIIYRSDAANRLSLRVRDMSSTNYLQADGSWAGSPTDFFLPNAGGWTEYTTVPTTLPNTGSYRLDLLQTTGDGSTYVNGFWIRQSLQWTAHDAPNGIYKAGFLDTPNVLLKASSWQATGYQERLSVVPKAASLAAIAAGEYWFEPDALYYRLAAGESDITAIHFEGLLDPTSTMKIAHDRTQLTNLWCSGGITALELAGGSNVALRRFVVSQGNPLPMYVSGATQATAFDFTVFGGDINHITGGHGNGIATEADGYDLVFTDFYVWGVEDDGIQPIGDGVLVCRRGVVYHTGSGSAVEVSTPTGGIFKMHNCTLVKNAPGNAEAIIRDKGDAAAVSDYANCILYSATPDGEAVIFDVPARDPGAITFEANLWYGPAGGVTEPYTGLNADPLLSDPTGGDYTLQAGSPAIDAGVEIPGVTDAYLGDGPDIGYAERG
jgi:hypothetical protein